MSAIEHLNNLKQREVALDMQISEGFQHHLSDEALKMLKIKRLNIKDEEMLFAKLHPESQNNT